MSVPLPPLPKLNYKLNPSDVLAMMQDYALNYGRACREDEREACAELAAITVCDTHLPTGVKIYGSRAAAAIRARSKK